MKYYQTPEFQKLQAEWEDKLKESQFNDAEWVKGNARNLKQRAGYAYRRSTALDVASKTEYFARLSQHVAAARFADKRHKAIMQLAAAGLFPTEIVEELAKKGINTSKHEVIYLTRRYVTKWKIRKWTLKQQGYRQVTRS